MTFPFIRYVGMGSGIVAVALLFLHLSALSFQTPADASISGRITAPTGQPLVAMQVWLFRPELDLKARKVLWKSVAMVTTDDRGEYRHFGIAPGRYYIASGSISPTMSPQVTEALSRRPLVATVITETRRYATEFYPGTAEPAKASALDVKAGSELKGINFVLPLLRTFAIRGRFIDDSGALPANARVTYTMGWHYRDPAVSQGASGGSARITPDSQNNFQIADVPPGRYWVAVTIAAVIGTPPTPPAVGPRASPPTPEEDTARQKEFVAFLASPSLKFVRGLAAVDVVDSDLDGIVIHCKLATAIQGRIAVEGRDWASFPGKERIRVSISPPIYGIQPAEETLPMPPIEVRADGTFGYPMILPWDDYRLEVVGLPEDTYVKDARVGSKDVLGKAFSLSEPASDSFEVLLGTKGGRIEGNAPPKATVVLAPEAQLERIDLYRTTTVDASGRFTLRGIAPGGYHLFAFATAADSYRAAGSPGGATVRISEGATAAMDLRLEP